MQELSPDSIDYIIRAHVVAGQDTQVVIVTRGGGDGYYPNTSESFVPAYGFDYSDYGKDTVVYYDDFHLIYMAGLVIKVIDRLYFRPESTDTVCVDSVVLCDDAGHRWRYRPKQSPEDCHGRVYEFVGADVVAGREYTIAVTIEGRTYSASAVTPKPVKGSVRFHYLVKYLKEGGFDLYPDISFLDPDAETKNHYLVTSFFPAEGLFNHFAHIPAMLASDAQCDAYGRVEFVLLENLGTLTYGTINSATYYKGEVVGSEPTYYIYTIDPATFNYLTSLSRQMSADGGAFTAAPYSPYSVFSPSDSRIQGYFMAASVLRQDVVIDGSMVDWE